MSVTIDIPADDIASAWIPLIWDTSSNRDVTTGLAVTTVEDNGSGKCRYNVGDTSQSKVDDVVTGSGFTEPYNVKQNITLIFSGTKFDTDLDFTATDTGTLTVTNDNFFVRCKITGQIGGLLDITQVTDEGGGTISFKTTQNHELIVGDLVIIAQTTSYDKAYVVTGITTSAQFRVTGVFVATETGLAMEAKELGIKKIEAQDAGIFRFDVSNFLQTILSADIEDLGTSSLFGQSKGLKYYEVEFSELWDAADGTVFENTDLTISLKRASDTTIQHAEAQDMDVFTVDGTSKSFFTDGEDIPISEDDEWHLSWFSDDNQQLVNINRLDINRNFVSVSNISGIFTAEGKLMFPLNSTTVTGVFDANGIFYFDVFISEFPSANQLTKKIRFVKIRKCLDGKKLYWRNLRGGIDSYTFGMDSTTLLDPKKRIYERDKGLSFNVKDAGGTVLSSKPNTLVSISSEFVTNSQAAWIAVVNSSSNVWVKEGNDLIPIVMREFDMETNSKDLIRYKIRYTLANKLIVNA